MNHELSIIFTPDGFIPDRTEAAGATFYFDENLFTGLSADPYKTLFDWGFAAWDARFSASLAFLYDLSATFVKTLSHDSDLEVTRRAKPASPETALDILHRTPYAVGVEFINIPWINRVWDRLVGVFDTLIQTYDGTVFDFLHSKSETINVVGRVFFHLVENKEEEYPFAFLATYSTGSAEKLSHLPLRNALREYHDRQDQLLQLLSTVSRAADRSDFISELTESGELFSPLKFKTTEAYTVLTEIPVYEECGIVCRMPDWWKRKNNVRVSVSIGSAQPSMVGLDALLSFDPTIFLGDTEMSRSEIEALLSQSGGLSFLKGKWVEVNHDKLRAALDAFDKASEVDGMTFAEAMRMQLTAGYESQDSGVTVEISNGEWLQRIKNRMRQPSDAEPIRVGKDFKAELRPYQQTGVNWLAMMKGLGFGSLLADDMGLGKTVQILALLECLRNYEDVKALLIIPASLICNWQQEAARFAPMLRVRVIQAGSRDVNPDDADLFITTYGMVTRLKALQEVHWDIIILDEAQAIKNSGTKQTKAVKTLKTDVRIAMTGTPIENRLSDLWSIFDFLNPGLLGTAKEFSAFAKELKENTASYTRLREIASPFMLRRLKTDKTVIADLPDKIEIKAFTTLTKKQIVLYKALIKEMEAAIQDAEGIGRKGMVLAGIMKFKQICNHPDQYLGQQAYDASHSGKFDKLAEIVETIFEKRERVLIFTQFKEMTQPIADYLESVFGRKGLVLHGGTAVKKRGALVEQFNGAEYIPFMVLSVKAGGVGLNLTAANHVVHFDRWWNPAVENQATDRAFRIGQQKNVTVHKFITQGTIEEKIDKMLEEKQQLADEIVTAGGEQWITELSNDALMELFKLEV